MSGSNGDDERTRIVPPPPPPPPPKATPEQHGNALALGTYLSEFELTGVIGEGGFGIVYDAWDHSLQRRVALKEYMPSSLASRENSEVRLRSARHRETFDAGLKSFVNEARLLAQFDHPSLVKVYRFWEGNGTAYMVMPLYQGITLKDKLREMFGRGQRPDEPWLMNLLAPLTEALAVIHAERCFHRDIAPDNIILLSGSERPLLLDFGAARRVIGDMTQALTVILKPGYAPVEQYAETPNMKQGAWTDVYALAATVHWAITGKTPPPSVSRLMSDAYVPLTESAQGRYSATFLAAVDKALRVRPEERTQDIEELRTDMGLDAWASTQPMATRARTVQPVHVPPGRTGGPTTTTGPAPLPPAPTQPPPAPTPPHHTLAPTIAVPRPAPAPITDPLGEPPPAPAPVPAARDAYAPPKSRTGLFVGAGVGVAALAAIGAYVAFGGSPKPAPPAPAPSVAAAPTPAPAAAPVASPAPPPAAGPFEPRQEFDKVLAARTPGFDVTAAAVRSQLRVSKKDKLSFAVTSSRDGYLHVLVLGPDGSLLQLFPNDEATNHRIQAGRKVSLPDEIKWSLEASEPTGPEYFLVVVSATPRDYSPLYTGEKAAWGMKVLHTGAEATTLAARWPARTPVLLGAATGCSGGPECDTYGAAIFSVEITK